MALTVRNLVALLIITTLCQVCFAVVYKVGDSAGWTLPVFGNVDYDKWASPKKFHVGDVLVFKYNRLFHNVKQVTKQHSKTCNAKFPIATYTSGSDYVTLKTLGDLYFVSGVPGQCHIGQKLHIKVIPFPVVIPIPVIIPIPLPQGNNTSPAPSPASNVLAP